MILLLNVFPALEEICLRLNYLFYRKDSSIYFFPLSSFSFILPFFICETFYIEE